MSSSFVVFIECIIVWSCCYCICGELIIKMVRGYIYMLGRAQLSFRGVGGLGRGMMGKRLFVVYVDG